MKTSLRRLAVILCATAAACCLPGTMAERATASPERSPSGPTRLLRYADISKDSVAFIYAGDLWVASRQGGAARRLTSNAAELYPKFSPDGKWIAFTGNYDGNRDVYVVPVAGGEPKRLTFHPSNDIVLGWSPDGKDILFRSDRYSAPPGRYTRLFLISPRGGEPHMLQVPRADLTSFSPDGTKIAYIETSQEFRTWKRYRGGWSLPIAIFDLKQNTYEELPKTDGMDLFPMWHANTIYFVSYRGDGVMNLYSYDLGSKQTKKLTDYKEFDIKWPSLGPDAIVYENGGLLYEYNLETGKTRNIPIQVHAEDIQTRPEFKNVAEHIGSFAISPSGVRAVVEARGNVFTIPAEHGSIRTLSTDNSGVHELNPVWSPDGKWIAYLSDKTGEYEVYLRPQLGGADIRLTTDGNMYRYGPTWSPDSKKLLYWDKLHRLWWIGIDEKKPVKIDEGDYADISDASWSPDSKWVTYSKADRRGASQMYLYNLDGQKVSKISDGYYSDTNPVFDPDGKYIFFLSQRYFYPSVQSVDPTQIILFSGLLVPVISLIFIVVINSAQIKEPFTYNLPYYIFLACTPIAVIFFFFGPISWAPYYKLGVGLALTSAPAAVVNELYKRRKRAVESKLSNFLRDISEIRKTGLAPEKTIEQLADRKYGALTKHVKKISVQLSWGAARLSFRGQVLSS